MRTATEESSGSRVMSFLTLVEQQRAALEAARAEAHREIDRMFDEQVTRQKLDFEMLWRDLNGERQH